MEWISVKNKLPTKDDADDKGYVMIYQRQDRQWGWPTRVGFGKWNRVTPKVHTHWAQILPEPPIS